MIMTYDFDIATALRHVIQTWHDIKWILWIWSNHPWPLYSVKMNVCNISRNVAKKKSMGANPYLPYSRPFWKRICRSLLRKIENFQKLGVRTSSPCTSWRPYPWYCVYEHYLSTVYIIKDMWANVYTFHKMFI